MKRLGRFFFTGGQTFVSDFRSRPFGTEPPSPLRPCRGERQTGMSVLLSPAMDGFSHPPSPCPLLPTRRDRLGGEGIQRRRVLSLVTCHLSLGPWTLDLVVLPYFFRFFFRSFFLRCERCLPKRCPLITPVIMSGFMAAPGPKRFITPFI